MPQLKNLIAIVVGVVVLIGLSIPFYHNLNVNSWRSEAQVMLSYIRTLESAYHTDSGQYAYFDEYYGSQINGLEKCDRPLGAEELGLVLRRCKNNPRKGGLRYAYRVLNRQSEDAEDFADNYRAEALSGSDVTGDNFVCIGSTTTDLWAVEPDKKSAYNVHYCE